MLQTVALAASTTALIPALQRDIVYLCGAYLGDQGRLPEVVSLLKIQNFMKKSFAHTASHTNLPPCKPSVAHHLFSESLFSSPVDIKDDNKSTEQLVLVIF